MIVPIKEATIRKKIIRFDGEILDRPAQPTSRNFASAFEAKTPTLVQVFTHVLKQPGHRVTLRGGFMSPATVGLALGRAEISNISHRSHRNRGQHGVNFGDLAERPNDQVGVEVSSERVVMSDVISPIDKTLGRKIADIAPVVSCLPTLISLHVRSLHSIRDDDGGSAAKCGETCEELLIVPNPGKKDSVTKGLPSGLPAGSFPWLSAGRSLPRENVCEHEPSCPNRNSKSLPSTRHESPKAAARKMSFSVKPSNTEVAA